MIAGYEPCYMTLGLPTDAAGRLAGDAQPHIAAELGGATAAACGPGLGRSAELDDLVAWLYRETRTPASTGCRRAEFSAVHVHVTTSPGGPRALTPHPGEFARLMKLDARRPRPIACGWLWNWPSAAAPWSCSKGIRPW